MGDNDQMLSPDLLKREYIKWKDGWFNDGIIKENWGNIRKAWFYVGGCYNDI